jgi:Flp pilus assembly pilin Flp
MTREIRYPRYRLRRPAQSGATGHGRRRATHQRRPAGGRSPGPPIRLREETGQSVVEYLLLLTYVIFWLMLGLTFLGGRLTHAFTTIAAALP